MSFWGDITDSWEGYGKEISGFAPPVRTAITIHILLLSRHMPTESPVKSGQNSSKPTKRIGEPCE